jgi:Fur family ferric uptake transcriptional regulator
VTTISGLRERLKKAGYKLTPARRAVIEVLESNRDHLSHNEILNEGQKLYARLSRATVYRTMETLVELNLVRSIYLNDPTQRFMSAAGGHHHLICTNCDAVLEFDHCTVDQLSRDLAEKFNFQVRNHLLEFQGLCENCQQI